uniref:Uncharacterized protein n=1 Tax=Setaria viridis TaxID=4556 RepID=A0A4U6TZJ1_SETVI|nr:hypothetical protein SEVIR_7G296150v2 [Setaria viridis]
MPRITSALSSTTTTRRCSVTSPSSLTNTSLPLVSSSTTSSPMLVLQAVRRALKLPDPLLMRAVMVASTERLT